VRVCSRLAMWRAGPVGISDGFAAFGRRFSAGARRRDRHPGDVVDRRQDRRCPRSRPRARPLDGDRHGQDHFQRPLPEPRAHGARRDDGHGDRGRPRHRAGRDRADLAPCRAVRPQLPLDPRDRSDAEALRDAEEPHPLARGLGKMARAVVDCAGVGVCTSDYGQLKFAKVRRPIYPLDLPNR
jgi:hypothetical protein